VKYIINGQPFKTKAALQRYVREILNAQLGEVDDAHVPFLIDLFSRHQDADQKFGVGLKYIRVVLAMPYETRCFEIERVDGTRTDISYLECLSPSTVFDWLPAACRTAVVDQIQAFKDAEFSAGPVACAVTGEIVTRETCHVDHAPPWTFEVIVESFLDNSVYDLAQIGFVDGDNVTTYQFVDREIAEHFARFHAEHASLRVVSKQANLSLLRRGK
jgi:hypothetical protein